MAKTTLIDKLDLEILKLLSRDSKISFSEISNLLKVSNTTIHVRIKRLQKLEVIKNFTITIDYNKLGFNYTCYMGIYLDKASNRFKRNAGIPPVQKWGAKNKILSFSSSTYTKIAKFIPSSFV